MQKRYRIVATLSIVALLTVSSVSLRTLAQVSPQANWYTDGNEPFNHNYSPQTQIGSSNVNGLAVKWIFPIPAAPPPFAGQGQEGVVASPLIVGGVVYFITNWNQLYSVSGSTGSVVFQKSIPISSIAAKSYQCGLAAVKLGCGVITGTHIHNGQMQYTSSVLGLPVLWISTAAYQIYAYNALTGDLVRNFTWFDPNQTVPGSYGLWDPLSSHMIVVDQQRGILTIGTENVDCQCEARGFLEGWNILANPPKLLWGPTFLIPPQDGSDPNWSLNSVGNMTHAWIFNAPQSKAVDLKSLPSSQLHDMLYKDWGTFGYNGTRSYAGLGVNWGGPWALDQKTGTAYVSTAEAADDWNATYRPGPNLWSASVLAVNDQTGKFVWGFQATPHDLWDLDCSWGTILANVTISGTPQQEIIKGCKNGYIYGLNAATGAMDWSFFPPSQRVYHYDALLNPLNRSDMMKPWMNYPGGPVTIVSGANHIEADPAYDPTTNTVFISTFNSQSSIHIINAGPRTDYVKDGLGRATLGPVANTQNSSIWAINANNGQAVWHYSLGNFGVRGGPIVSNGLVYAETPTGAVDFFDVKTGKLVGSTFLGAPSIVQPSMGSDTNGNAIVVFPVTSLASGSFGLGGIAATPGAVLALSLGGASIGTTSAQVTTVTATSATTVTATSAQTTTVTTGVDTGTFYGVVGLLAIFIVVSGVLALRRRKPAS